MHPRSAPGHRSARQTAWAAVVLALLALAVLSFGTSAKAQHAGGGALPATTPPREAAQFDFLIGQWNLDVTPKVSGLAAMIHGAPKLSGVWKAWRAFDGFGIEDELRLVDASANPLALNHSLRLWDTRNRRWQLHGLDVYRARLSTAQGQWQDGEMRINGSGTNPEGQPTLTRTRFYDIGANGFRMKQDRSNDNGASWDEGVLTIVATRSAAKAAR